MSLSTCTCRTHDYSVDIAPVTSKVEPNTSLSTLQYRLPQQTWIYMVILSRNEARSIWREATCVYKHTTLGGWIWGFKNYALGLFLRAFHVKCGKIILYEYSHGTSFCSECVLRATLNNKWVEKERDGGWVSRPSPKSSISVKSHVMPVSTACVAIHSKQNAIW